MRALPSGSTRGLETRTSYKEKRVYLGSVVRGDSQARSPALEDERALLAGGLSTAAFRSLGTLWPVWSFFRPTEGPLRREIWHL